MNPEQKIVYKMSLIPLTDDELLDLLHQKTMAYTDAVLEMYENGRNTEIDAIANNINAECIIIATESRNRLNKNRKCDIV